MTEAEFSVLYHEALTRMTLWVSTQATMKQRTNAMHQKHHLLINRGFYLNIAQKEEETLYMCSNCGTLACRGHYVQRAEDELMSAGLCFYCNHYWRLTLPGAKRSHALVIEGETYHDAGAVKQGGHGGRGLGFGGADWHYRMNGSEEVIHTNNLWHGGIVPEEFRWALQDNAVFVKEPIEPTPLADAVKHLADLSMARPERLVHDSHEALVCVHQSKLKLMLQAYHRLVLKKG